MNADCIEEVTSNFENVLKIRLDERIAIVLDRDITNNEELPQEIINEEEQLEGNKRHQQILHLQEILQKAGDKQKEELKEIASFFAIEADLAASLLDFASITTQIPEYVSFLLTPFQGLVGYWSMNESDGKVISDRAGNNDGTLQGNPEWKEVTDFPDTDSRKVLKLDGNGDYVEVQAHSNPTQAITIAVWAKSNTETWNHYGFLVSKRPAYVLSSTQDKKTISFLVFQNGQWKAVEFTPEIDLREWHHYAGIFDGSTIRLYIDGEEVANSIVDNVPISLDNGPLLIGKDDFDRGPDSSFNGQIAEVGIWNIALNAEQIQQVKQEKTWTKIIKSSQIFKWSEIVKFFQFLSRILLLTKKLELTPTELKCIPRNLEAFDISEPSQSSPFKLTINNIQTIDRFKKLIAAFNDDKNKLVEYFGREEKEIDELARLTGWKSEQISLVVSPPENQENDRLNLGRDLHKTVDGITKLKHCFNLSHHLGVNISWFSKLLKLENLPVAGGIGKLGTLSRCCSINQRNHKG